MRKCGNCRFMRAPYTVPPNLEGGTAGYQAGWCHRHPPIMSQDLQSASHRPVKLAGWCGEWRLAIGRLFRRGS